MKTLLNKVQLLAIIAIALGLTMTISCSDDDEPAPTETLMGLVTASDELDSLEKYLKFYPDLVASLEASGDFTLFAPSNSAFVSLLLQTEGFPSNILSINPDIIKNVLAYHISATRYEVSDLKAGVAVATQSQGNEVITVNDDGRTLFTGSSNKEIVITTKNVKATNGVMHIVGSVMVPPSVGDLLIPNLGKTSGAILLGASFSILAEVLVKSEAYAATSDQIPSLLGILSGTAAHTIFAPSNGTFEAGSLTAASFTAEQWYGILATHIVMSTVNPADLVGQAQFTAVSGATLTVLTTQAPTKPEQGILTGIAIDANGDVTAEAQVAVTSNMSSSLETPPGQIHVIAGILNPTPAGN